MDTAPTITLADVDRWFTYSAPGPDGVVRIRAIRGKARELAVTVLACTPPGGDQAAAIERLREAVMFAAAAIVLGPEETVA